MSEKKCGGYIPCDNLQVKGAWRRLLARLDQLIINVDIHTMARINQQSLITNHMLTCACKCRIHNFGMSDVQFLAFQVPAARRWWHVSRHNSFPRRHPHCSCLRRTTTTCGPGYGFDSPPRMLSTPYIRSHLDGCNILGATGRSGVSP